MEVQDIRISGYRPHTKLGSPTWNKIYGRSLISAQPRINAMIDISPLGGDIKSYVRFNYSHRYPRLMFEIRASRLQGMVFYQVHHVRIRIASSRVHMFSVGRDGDVYVVQSHPSGQIIGWYTQIPSTNVWRFVSAVVTIIDTPPQTTLEDIIVSSIGKLMQHSVVIL